MFCHPENIEYRLDEYPIMRWQHVMLFSDMHLTILLVESKVSQILLCQESKILERVDIAYEASRIYSLRLTVLDVWVTFKWVSPQGNTQFQVKFHKLADCDTFLQFMARSGVKIVQKREGTTIIDPVVDPRYMDRQNGDLFCQSMSQHQNSQLECTYYSQNQSTPTQFSQGFAKQMQKSYSQYSQTQFSRSQAYDADPSSLRLKLLRDDNAIQSHPSSTFSSGDILSDDSHLLSSSRTSSHGGASSDVLSLADCQSTHSLTTGRRILHHDLTIKTLDIPALVKNKVPLNLNVQKYSFGDINHRSREQKLIWRHLGLVSGLCLSLVPSDHNANPIVLLTRGTEQIDAFVPHPGYLRAKCVSGTLHLERFNTDHHSTKRLVQLQMKDANVIAASQWLREWLVNVEGVMPSFPATDTTCDMSIMASLSSRGTPIRGDLLSDDSTLSRETRFWLRRDKKLSTL